MESDVFSDVCDLLHPIDVIRNTEAQLISRVYVIDFGGRTNHNLYTHISSSVIVGRTRTKTMLLTCISHFTVSKPKCENRTRYITHHD